MGSPWSSVVVVGGGGGVKQPYIVYKKSPANG